MSKIGYNLLTLGFVIQLVKSELLYTIPTHCDVNISQVPMYAQCMMMALSQPYSLTAIHFKPSLVLTSPKRNLTNSADLEQTPQYAVSD